MQATLVAVSLLVMSMVLWAQWHEIPRVGWSIQVPSLALSLVALVAVYFLNAYGWHLILESMGCPLSSQRSVRIWLLSSLTRYLPGGVWGYASRATMAHAAGVNLATSGLSLYLETFLATATAIMVGLIAALFSLSLPVSLIHIAAAWGICSVLLHPRIIAFTRFMPGRVGKALGGVKLPTWKELLALYGYYLGFWLVFGLIFALFVNSIYPMPIADWPYVGASLGLAFSAGLVAVVFPGGIGVRESVLYLLLGNVMPPAASLVVAVSSRVWNIVGEFLSVSLLLLWKKE